jgi:dTDP-4-dehydrorhamnose reductase
MRVLLLGATGQVGQEIRLLDFPDNIEFIAPPRSVVDLNDPESIASVIAAGPWAAVINAAGYTDVDQAESEPIVAYSVNSFAPSRLATETARRGIPLIHISTDYVFDGHKGTPYVEHDKTNPLNVYGRSKLVGEEAIRASNPRHIVLRTSWVYSPFRNNFVKTILRLAAKEQRISIVTDQRGCPTAAQDLAIACRAIALGCALDPEKIPYGIYHFAGEGDTTWFEFAETILQMVYRKTTRVPQILPITTAEHPRLAVRPADSRLDCTAIARCLDIIRRPWREALEKTINRLLGSNLQ